MTLRIHLRVARKFVGQRTSGHRSTPRDTQPFAHLSVRTASSHLPSGGAVVSNHSFTTTREREREASQRTTVCVCVCVCVQKREREREQERKAFGLSEK